MMLRTFAGGDAGFNELVLEALGALPADEEVITYLLASMYNNNQRYYLYASIAQKHLNKSDLLLVSPPNAPTKMSGVEVSACLSLSPVNHHHHYSRRSHRKSVI